MNIPKITVVIPCYNVEEYLPCCLDSLLAQTFHEIEILCIDDTSSDNSAQVIRGYQEQDGRVRLLQQEHKGVSAARNLGIREAKGEYIFFLDADDWVEPETMEKLFVCTEKTKYDIVTCSSKVHFEQDNVDGFRRRKSLQSALTVSEGIWMRENPMCGMWQLMDRPGVWPFVWNKLIRRSLITQNNIEFPVGLALGEDGVFLYLLFCYAESVAFLPDTLHHYRYQRKNSATVRLFVDSSTRFHQHVEVVEAMLHTFREHSFLRNNEVELLSWTLRFLYGDFIHLPISQRQKNAEKIRHLTEEYELSAVSGELNIILRKRLHIMTNPNRRCTQMKRILDILSAKIENRLLRFFR